MFKSQCVKPFIQLGGYIGLPSWIFSHIIISLYPRPTKLEGGGGGGGGGGGVYWLYLNMTAKFLSYIHKHWAQNLNHLLWRMTKEIPHALRSWTLFQYKDALSKYMDSHLLWDHLILIMMELPILVGQQFCTNMAQPHHGWHIEIRPFK